MNDIRLSYSKLSQFDQCPRSYFLEHIQGCRDDDNFYSQYGSLVHDLIRSVLTKEIDVRKIMYEYDARYDAEITKPFPAMLKDASVEYYCAGAEYLANGIYDLLEYNPIAVEEKFEMPMFDCTFVGILDFLGEHRPDGKIVLIDHKSSSAKQFSGKQFDKKARQLYLYADYVKQKIGKYPDAVAFNCFRDGKFVEKPFDMNLYDETMEWASETTLNILEMRKRFSDDESKWTLLGNRFFCPNVCGMYDQCEISLRL